MNGALLLTPLFPGEGAPKHRHSPMTYRLVRPAWRRSAGRRSGAAHARHHPPCALRRQGRGLQSDGNPGVNGEVVSGEMVSLGGDCDSSGSTSPVNAPSPQALPESHHLTTHHLTREILTPAWVCARFRPHELASRRPRLAPRLSSRQSAGGADRRRPRSDCREGAGRVHLRRGRAPGRRQPSRTLPAFPRPRRPDGRRGAARLRALRAAARCRLGRGPARARRRPSIAWARPTSPSLATSPPTSPRCSRPACRWRSTASWARRASARSRYCAGRARRWRPACRRRSVHRP